MNASELKYRVEQSGNCEHFFTRSTMRFFGDTMRNYGVRRASIIVHYDDNGDYMEAPQLRDAWELYRKRAVKHGLKSSAYFDCGSFRRLYPAEGADHETI